MQPPFILFGLLAVGAGLFFQYGAGPETQDGWNWFMVAFGVVLLWGGIGTIPHDKPAALAQTKRSERAEETPADIARREEREWRTNQNSKAHIRCAAQFRAYVERREPHRAEEFLSEMNGEFYDAVKIGAKIIREHEERY